jgi:diguanylate cyclase (GGDEF)-like protein/PAS domain S-box-containing protein
MTQLELTKELAISITASLPIGVWIVSNQGEIVYANPKAEAIFGFNQDELLGKLVEELIPEGDRKAHRILREKYALKPVNVAMSGGRVLTGLNKSGQGIQLQIGLNTLTDTYTLVSFIESTNEILKPANANDPLTGLANRNLFIEKSEMLRKLAIRNQRSLSVLFIDLDSFKAVNDQFGHDTGDALILEIANVLRSNLRGNDVIARIGGDEFVVCLYDVADREDLKNIANKLIRSICAISTIKGHPIDIGASIGAVFTLTAASISINEMINSADKLMYQSKKIAERSAITSQV